MRVLIVADVEGWCFWHWAQGIRKYASCTVDVVTQSEFRIKESKDYDGILQMSWGESVFGSDLDGINRSATVVANPGVQWPYRGELDPIWTRRRVTKIRNLKTAKERLPSFDRVICTNRELHEAVSCITEKSVYCHPGVDHNLFTPSGRQGGVIGWCGQSHEFTKGYDTVWRLVKERLGSQFEFREVTGTAHEPKLTLEQMAEWHCGNDLFVCTSCAEGVPMPVLESLSCNVPVISTRCGSVADTVDSRFIVDNYDNEIEAERAAQAIVELIQSGTWRDHEPRQRVLDNFTWERKADEWIRWITN